MASPALTRLIAKLFARPLSRRDRRAARLAVERLEAREVPSGTETGYVFVDANGDGVRNSGEAGAADVLLTAFDNSWAPAASDTTDATGYYEITNVPDDSYNTQLTLPTGTTYSFGSAGAGITTMWYPMYMGSVIDIPVYAPAPLPVVSVTRMNDAVEGSTAGQFRFARTGPTTDALTASYLVRLIGPGFADPGGDYAALPGSVTFGPGQATVDADVVAYQDNIAENPETVDVLVMEGSGYVASEQNALVWIWDDYSLLPPEVSVTGIADAVEGGAVGVLRFARTGGTADALVAGYAISGGMNAATPEVDYMALSGSVTFPVGVSVVDVLVTAMTDTTTEGTETVTAVVLDGSGYAAGTPDTGVVKIADAGAAPGSELGMIGGIVFEDANADGIRGELELPRAKYPVTLRDSEGVELFTILTAADGSYAFGGLEAGSYTVDFGRPNFEVFTLKDQGIDESADSDADPTTGLTDPIPLVTGAMNYLLVGLGVLVQPPGPRVVIVDKDMKEAKDLYVAKWHAAFTDSGFMKGPDSNNFDFIDLDDDRFGVWVYDKISWDDPAKSHIWVQISSSNVAGFGAYDDLPTSIDLVKFFGPQRGAGWYWSESQMLVSNEVDDRYSFPTYLGSDDTDPTTYLGLQKHGQRWYVSDRTHRTALRGTITAAYVVDETVIAASTTAYVPVSKTVNINVNIMKNGTAAAPGSASITEAEANMAIHKANEQFAQAQILLVPNYPGIPVRDPPGFVDFTNGFFGYPPYTTVIAPTPEEQTLIGADFRTAATDDVELYFVNYFELGGRRGEAFAAADVPDSKYAGTVIISVRDRKPFTIAHEIGHILLNTGNHVTGPQEYVNLMRSETSTIDEHWSSKRLTKVQATTMRGS